MPFNCERQVKGHTIQSWTSSQTPAPTITSFNKKATAPWSEPHARSGMAARNHFMSECQSILYMLECVCIRVSTWMSEPLCQENIQKIYQKAAHTSNLMHTRVGWPHPDLTDMDLAKTSVRYVLSRTHAQLRPHPLHHQDSCMLHPEQHGWARIKSIAWPLFKTHGKSTRWYKLT